MRTAAHRAGHHHHHHIDDRHTSGSADDSTPPPKGLRVPVPALLFTETPSHTSPFLDVDEAATPTEPEVSASQVSAFLTPLRLFVLTHQASFLVTGIIQTLGAQWLYYSGAATPITMLTVFAQYFGMSLVILVPSWLGIPPGSSAPEYIQLSRIVDDVTTLEADGIPGRSTSPESNRPTFSPQRKSRRTAAAQFASAGTGRFFSRAWRSFTKAAFLRGNEDSLECKDVLKLAIMDVSACAMITIGLFYVGSGLYQVIYSSIVAFTALLSRYFLGKSLSSKQWASIGIITAGLAMSAMGAHVADAAAANNRHESATAAGAVDVKSDRVSRSSFGASLVLAATILYAGIYTFNDRLLNKGPKPPRPEKLCIAIGFATTAISGAYLLLFTLPRYQTLVLDTLAPTSSVGGVLGMYATLVLASTAHNASFFVLIQHTGGVSTGVLQSLRAVAVFGLSHLWFCPSDSAQCLNFPKVVSTVLVACGVVLYSFAASTAVAQRPNSGTSVE